MTTETEAPRRFTEEEVLAVFATAGTFAAPMSTKRIGEAARVAAGVEPRQPENGRMHHDVSKTLAELVAAGKLVTSRAPRWQKGWSGFDEKYQHLIAEGNNTERFYATPAQAYAWKLKLEALAILRERADAVAAEIAERWGAPILVTSDYAAEPKIHVTLTLGQVARLFSIGIEA